MAEIQNQVDFDLQQTGGSNEYHKPRLALCCAMQLLTVDIDLLRATGFNARRYNPAYYPAT